MRKSSMGVRALPALAALLCIAPMTEAATITTFADPTNGGASNWLFQRNGNTFWGRWLGTGLTLETPGLAAPDFSDVTFTMDPVGVTDIGGIAVLDPGEINFFDNANQPLLTISWTNNALMLPTIGFGANDGVTFSGPIVDVALDDEEFAFSFTNFRSTANGFRVSSAFTSSAIPEPTTVMLTALCGASLLRRRRA